MFFGASLYYEELKLLIKPFFYLKYKNDNMYLFYKLYIYVNLPTVKFKSKNFKMIKYNFQKVVMV